MGLGFVLLSVPSAPTSCQDQIFVLNLSLFHWGPEILPSPTDSVLTRTPKLLFPDLGNCAWWPGFPCSNCTTGLVSPSSPAPLHPYCLQLHLRFLFINSSNVFSRASLSRDDFFSFWIAHVSVAIWLSFPQDLKIGNLRAGEKADSCCFQ